MASPTLLHPVQKEQGPSKRRPAAAVLDRAPRCQPLAAAHRFKPGRAKTTTSQGKHSPVRMTANQLSWRHATMLTNLAQQHQVQTRTVLVLQPLLQTALDQFWPLSLTTATSQTEPCPAPKAEGLVWPSHGETTKMQGLSRSERTGPNRHRLGLEEAPRSLSLRLQGPKAKSPNMLRP